MNLPNSNVVLESEGDEVTSLYGLVEQYQRNEILKPPHQRDQVWLSAKKAGWIDRLRGMRKPVGSILTYQLNNGQPSQVYLNDGFQRISTTLEYLLSPETYGDTKQEAEKYIRACKMPRQHRWYKSHDDALVDFQQINLGTHLTAYEMCKGVLTYMKNYELWEPVINNLHAIVPAKSQRIAKRIRAVSREQTQKEMRSDYATLHRFITTRKETSDYHTAKLSENMSDIQNKRVIEWILRLELEKRTAAEVDAEVKNLERLIERETALMEDVWYSQMGQNISKGISITLYRWVIDCAVWKRNNAIDNDVWEKFLVLLFKNCEGKSQLQRVDGGASRFTLNLSKLSSLKGVCDLIGSDMYYRYINGKEKKQKTMHNLKAGWDESHVLPFSTHGNGDVFPEPAGRNRARGAQPVA